MKEEYYIDNGINSINDNKIVLKLIIKGGKLLFSFSLQSKLQ